MADATIGVTQSVTPDRLLDAESLTIGVTVYRERNRLAGLGATELADVKGAAPSSGDMGLVVRQVGTVTVAPAGSTTSNAAALVAVSTSSVVVLASNAARKKYCIQNVGTTIITLGFGVTPTAGVGIILAPCAVAGDGTGGSWTDDIWDGAINAIGSASGGNVFPLEMT